MRDAVVSAGTRLFSEEFLIQARWEAILAATRVLARLDPRQRRLVRQLRSARGLHINLGSGPKPTPGWLNVDAVFGPDLVQHLGHPLELPDGCASIVFSEHVLEHLTYPTQVRCFLSEAFRILEPDGVIRVIVPDAEKVIRGYAEGDREAIDECTVSEPGLEPIEAVNKVFREHTIHKFAWDYAFLCRELEHAGFSDVRRASYRDSAVPAANADLDEEPRRRLSLYVEGRRRADRY
jgi:predicted SAM-dependent methyltransferase